MKKNGGKIYAKISPVGMKYCTGLYLGTPRERDEKEKLQGLQKQVLLFIRMFSSFIYFYVGNSQVTKPPFLSLCIYVRRCS
jgi:hypothetical protein